MGMTFNSAQEMLELITSGKMADLYNPKEETYIFGYNDGGSICVYSGIDLEAAKKFSEEALEAGEEYYWGAFLGAGGAIYDGKEFLKEFPEDYRGIEDEALEYCKEVYNLDGWMTTEEFAEDLGDSYDWLEISKFYGIKELLKELKAKGTYTIPYLVGCIYDLFQEYILSDKQEATLYEIVDPEEKYNECSKYWESVECGINPLMDVIR